MIEDLILTVASFGFVGADIRQAMKLHKLRQCATNGFSKWHFRLKIFSLVLVILAYSLLSLPFALTVAICQLVINIYIFKRIGGFTWQK
jgi:hypothetical protein